MLYRGVKRGFRRGPPGRVAFLGGLSASSRSALAISFAIF